MKEYLAEIVRAAPAPLQGRNLAREYLQARILGALQRAGAMIPLAFHGGTALRFLYHSARYSEDLAFTLARATEGYDFRRTLRAIRSTFSAEGYEVGLKVSDHGAVHSDFIRFNGLLYELGLSPHQDEILAVKIEVDTRPPAGAKLATTIVRRYQTLHLHHHDQATLLAGKLHAILQRPYTKGRDVHDLLWYLSDPAWPEPNLIMLNNALQQTGWDSEPLTGEGWRGVVRERLQVADWGQVRGDVAPFLEPPADAGMLTLENLSRLLE